jgi:hypothetical protein
VTLSHEKCDTVNDSTIDLIQMARKTLWTK